MKAMIDTNVIIDVYQNRAPFAATSAKVLKSVVVSGDG